MIELEDALIAKLFPPERVVSGMRVCKRFRQCLAVNAAEIHLSLRDCGGLARICRLTPEVASLSILLAMSDTETGYAATRA
eukprot:438687-Rhodomonas_salina.1